MRVLITGATGFLGGFLAQHYVERGWAVHGTTRGDRGEDRNWVTSDVALTTLDLCDEGAVSALIEAIEPDIVHHLAAQSSVSRSWDDPLSTLTTNIVAQHNVLTALKRLESTARVLVVGSCEEYGDVPPEDNPLTEGHELRPTSPYALSKVTQDLMGYQFAVHGLDVVRVRPFLQIGPRRSDTFVTGSFARQIAEIERGLRPAVIEVGNIDLVRDFTDVRDVARACALAAERGKTGEVYNIASGRGHTLRDLLSAMLDLCAISPEIRQMPGRVRPGEPSVLLGDASHLRAATGWQPEIAFQRSAHDALQYWRRHSWDGADYSLSRR